MDNVKFCGEMTCPHCGEQTLIDTPAQDETCDYVVNIEHDKLEEPSDMRDNQVALPRFYIGTDSCIECGKTIDLESGKDGAPDVVDCNDENDDEDDY